MRYVEVEHAEHFGFAGPGFDTRFVSLGYYLLQALDRLWLNLTASAALPPSQIVRTTPRGGTPGAAPPLSPDNIPPIASVVGPRDRIVARKGIVMLPD